jgi:hypothetical protein
MVLLLPTKLDIMIDGDGCAQYAVQYRILPLRLIREQRATLVLFDRQCFRRCVGLNCDRPACYSFWMLSLLMLSWYDCFLM